MFYLNMGFYDLSNCELAVVDLDSSGNTQGHFESLKCCVILAEGIEGQPPNPICVRCLDLIAGGG